MSETSEEQIHVRDYVRVIRRRLRLILAIMVVIVISAAIRTIRTIPVYEASARILIETEAPNIVSFEEVIDSMVDKEYYETQAKILTSRPIIERTIEELGLNEASSALDNTLPSSFPDQIRQAFQTAYSTIQRWLGVPEEQPASEEEQLADAESALIRRFLKRITISPLRGSRLLDVKTRSTDRKQAAQMANALVKNYIKYYLETRAAASQDAVSWLIKEVEDAKQRSQESEVALQQYKEDHEILSFMDRQNIVMQKLSDLSSAANQSKIRRMEVESQYKQLLSFQQGELAAVPEIIGDELVRQLKIKLLALESERTELLKKFRSKHPTVQALDSQIQSVQDQLEIEIQQVVTSIKNKYELAQLQEQELGKALEDLKVEAQELNQKSVQYNVLQREVDSNQRLYETLLQRAKETSLTERLETSNVRIIELAAIPSVPISPNKKRNLLLAIIVSLLVGVTLAFFLEYLDNSFRTPEEITRYLQIPFLGLIPQISTNEIVRYDEDAVQQTIVATITIVDAKSSISEAYRSLRTNVTFSLLERKVVLVTSAVPSEGKSSATANLAIALAQSGRKTLIIDGDMRRPIMDLIFQPRNVDRGFSDLLLHYETNNNGYHIENVIYDTGIPNLDLIPCVTIPPNPSELLEQNKTRQILTLLQEHYDAILIDSPPINVVTDPVILSHLVDGVILVIRAGATNRDAVFNAHKQLKKVDATILGGVLNDVNLKRDRYYKDYYGYKYSNYYTDEK